MGHMFRPLGRYFDFSGRSRRLEFWMFILLQIIIQGVLLGILISAAIEALDADGVLRDDGYNWFFSTEGALIPLILYVLVALFLLIPNIAVQVRRFHDQNKSGAWVLVNLIPGGSIVVIIMMFFDGTPGPNQYGPDPKNRQPMGYGYASQGGYPPPGAGGYPPQGGYGGHPGYGGQAPGYGGAAPGPQPSGWGSPGHPGPQGRDPNAPPFV